MMKDVKNGLTEEEKKKLEQKKQDTFDVEFDPDDIEGANVSIVIGIIN